MWIASLKSYLYLKTYQPHKQNKKAEWKKIFGDIRAEKY